MRFRSMLPRMMLPAVLLVATIVVATSGGASGTKTTISPSSVSAKTPYNDAEAGALAVKLLGPFKKVSGDTTRGISGHTITVAGVSTETAGGLPQFKGLCDGAEARFARANRTGGVNGYKINYLGCADDGASQQTAHQLLQTDVLQKNAFAVVPMASVVASAADGTFLNQNHVPFFGVDLSNAFCGWNSDAFGFSFMENIGCDTTPGHQFKNGYAISVYDSYKKKTPAHKIKWAFVGYNSPTVQAVTTSFVSIAKALGNQVAYAGNPGAAPGTPPLSNWDPVAQQIISSGATVVLDYTNAVTSLPTALRKLGYKGDIEGVAYDNPSLLAIPSLTQSLQGALAETAWVTSTAFHGPGISQVVSDLTAINSTASADNEVVLWGYASADMFLNALAHVKGKLTTEKLVNVINGGYTYPGIPNTIGPSIWPQGHVTASNWVGMVKVDPTTKSSTKVMPFKEYGSDWFVPSGT